MATNRRSRARKAGASPPQTQTARPPTGPSPDSPSDAYQDLLGYLQEGEEVEAVVLGDWSSLDGGANIPEEKKGTPLKLDRAEPFMRGWRVVQGFGNPHAHGLWVWTTRRFIWTTQYDGSVEFSCAPRNPPLFERCKPTIPGHS